MSNRESEHEYEYNPGSDDALERGCTCPVLDNNHGAGYMGTDHFVVRFDCPLHGQPTDNDESESDFADGGTTIS